MNILASIIQSLGIKGVAKGATVSAQATVSTVDADHNALDVTVLGTPALPADAATQTTLAALLAKVIAAPATEAKQDTGNASLASILAKIIVAPATEAKQDTGNSSLSTLAGIVAAGKAAISAAQLPASLGQAARASSLSVAQSTEDAAKVPALGQALAAGCVPVVLPAAQAAGALALQAQLPAALGPASPAASLSIANAVASTAQNASFPVAGVQIKASPGTCYSCTWTNTTGGTVYIQFYDASAQPSAGDSPLWYSGAIASGNIGSGGMGHITKGVPCPSTGIRAVLSSTQGTYTAIVSTSFKYVFFYE